VILGNDGDDTIFGDRNPYDNREEIVEGIDVIVGGDGDDTIIGDGGNDYLYGNNHNDTIFGGDGADYLNGGPGDDELAGGKDNDRIYGGDGDDLLEGNEGDDTLSGDNDNDTLKGGPDKDTLKGRAGEDVLIGGENTDQVDGGSGVDRILVLSNAQGQAEDLIVGLESQDAAVYFENGTNAATTWTDSQIDAVDLAFSILVQATGSNDFLKTSSGGSMTFQLIDVNEAGGINHGDGKIGLERGTFAANSRFTPMQVVLHEIGHNWENESPYWGEFMGLSGWTTFVWPWDTNPYVDGEDGWMRWENANFVSAYGEKKPREDFAEVFAYYFMNLAGEPFVPNKPDGYVADADDISGKLQIIDKIIDWLD
jgi:hypothetical protein